MTAKQNRVAILFPADSKQPLATRLEQSRFAVVAEALIEAGVDVVGAPFSDESVEHVRAKLLTVDSVLVWFNPNEGGRDRSTLNAMLRDIASRGIRVSAHPDVIDKMGTKEVLYRTRGMGWGSDTRFYPNLEAMRTELPARLAIGPRVLKQMRGQSGDGVWKVEAVGDADTSFAVAPDIAVRVRHAKRGCADEILSLDVFLARCHPYFAAKGAMIDQPYQPRLHEGMIRCYVVGDKVAGFGEQLVNALYPAPSGAVAGEAPQPGPRLYFPPTRPDFQPLKDKLEHQWIGELCQVVGLEKTSLPLLWDADFMYGPKDAEGADSYVLCEINVSSVYPFPPSALAPLVTETVSRVAGS